MRFVDEHVLDNIAVMISSNGLAASYMAKYVRCILFIKLIIKIESVLSLLVSYAVNAPLLKTLGITHLYDPDFLISTDKNIPLMPQTTDVIV